MKIRKLPIYDLQFHQERLANGPDDREFYTPQELALWDRWHRRAINALRRARQNGKAAPEFLVITMRSEEKHYDA